MKIIISSLTYSLPNGVTVSIDKSVDGLKKYGHQSLVISPRYFKKNHRAEHCQVPASPVTGTMASLIGRKEKTFGLTAIFHIEKIARQFKPDIYWLHTVFWSSHAFEQHMLKSDKVKVLTYHTLVEEYAKIYGREVGADLMRRRSERLANKMDAIITPTKMIKKKLQEYGVRQPIHVIPTGIAVPEKYLTKKELKEKFGLPANCQVLLYVGRVAPEKNIKSLFRIFKEVKKKNSRVFLLMIGPGDLNRFERISREMGIKNRVVLAGSFSPEQTRSIYGGSDIFVFPSKTETQGLVIGEAMMAGRPVVAFDSMIQPEIYPKKIALVARNENQFCSHILQLLDSQDKRQAFSEKAKKFVINHFSEEQMIKKQTELFTQLLLS